MSCRRHAARIPKRKSASIKIHFDGKNVGHFGRRPPPRPARLAGPGRPRVGAAGCGPHRASCRGTRLPSSRVACLATSVCPQHGRRRLRPARSRGMVGQRSGAPGTRGRRTGHRSSSGSVADRRRARAPRLRPSPRFAGPVGVSPRAPGSQRRAGHSRGADEALGYVDPRGAPRSCGRACRYLHAPGASGLRPTHRRLLRVHAGPRAAVRGAGHGRCRSPLEAYGRPASRTRWGEGPAAPTSGRPPRRGGGRVRPTPLPPC